MRVCFPEIVNTRKPQPHKTSLAVHQDVWFRDDRTVTGQPLAICFACSQLLSKTHTHTHTNCMRAHIAPVHTNTQTQRTIKTARLDIRRAGGTTCENLQVIRLTAFALLFVSFWKTSDLPKVKARRACLQITL